ncbi:GNAT family N-acetyltransferase [Luteolibacter flavescens]|uniref:GNAT family N-acetyltransferase n=1 Tax=Luteolibacter flavescens TaxID=1859460 RepID=A0ABT3FLN6_9BACT|nr:GNAT family N-acetyltransferase [Luteolibacter flavescens]MCW1883885.1 GNAT family N-acetyltransferase [Luteolibacter flavescens]
MSTALIRPYRHGDHVAIASIFCRAVHEIGIRHYTVAQCEAWSGTKPDPGHWEQRCERKKPFVSIVDGEIAGFLELDPDGHIDCAYVNPDFQRRGIMSALVKHAVGVAAEGGLSRVYVEASIGARPMFGRLGFVVLCEQQVAIGGETLVNYRMEFVLP